jgi:plasmid replication initiation protein
MTIAKMPQERWLKGRWPHDIVLSDKVCYADGMGRIVEGGIKEHQDLTRFTAVPADVAAKDQIDLMSRNWFSLTPGRHEPILHEFINAKTGLKESVRITGSHEHGGIATIYDQDLLMFAISQWVEAKQAGVAVSRRVHFTPYQFFSWLSIAPHGTACARLKDALHRLKMTSIETTVRSETGKHRQNRMKQFSWISEWEITADEDGVIRGIEVVLAEWLFDSIADFHVLTLDKRYFDIPGTLERWLYRYARKATGGANGVWRETFKNLYQKSSSQQEYKHFASALRKLVKKDALPGFKIEKVSSSLGKDMLRMERIEKRQALQKKQADLKPEQFELIEKTPLEEAWENVLEILCVQLTEPTVNSWLKGLRIVGLEQGTLTFKATNKFIADTVQSRFSSRLLASWQSLGHDVKEIRFESSPSRKAA